MSIGGSPPALLSSSYLSDPSWWLQFKWLQPPPLAPEWLFDYYERYNPPANVGRPLCDEERHQRAIREDQQSAGLLLPEYGGPILHGARARADRAYRDWKAVIADLWGDESPELRGHSDRQTVVFFLSKVLCDDANIYICIALKIINTPVNRSSSLN